MFVSSLCCGRQGTQETARVIGAQSHTTLNDYRCVILTRSTFFGDILINGAKFPAYATEAQATLLGPDAVVRFVPHQHFNGVVQLGFKAWDLTVGASGDYNVDTRAAVQTGAFSLTVANATLLVESVNDVPVVDLDTEVNGTDTSVTFEEGSEPIHLVDEHFEVSDLDHRVFTQLSITLFSAYDGAEEFVNITTNVSGLNVTTEMDSSSVVVTLITAAESPLSVEQTAEIVGGLVYGNTADEPDLTDRLIRINISDGLHYTAADVTVYLQPINEHAPVLDLGIIETGVVENGPRVSLVNRSTLSLVDLDHNDVFLMASATIILHVDDTVNRTEQTLEVNATDSINGTYDRDSGVLLLTGAASVTAYEDVLRSLSYLDASEEPSLSDRFVSVVVSDGVHDSNVVNVTISMTLINDQIPTLHLDGPSINYTTTFTEELGAVGAVGAVRVRDRDSGNFLILGVTVTIDDAMDDEVLAAVEHGAVSTISTDLLFVVSVCSVH